MFSHVGCSWDVGNDASGNAQSGEGGDGSGGGGGGGDPGGGGGAGMPPGTAGSTATSSSGMGGGGVGSGIEVPEGGAKPNNILIYIGMIEQRATEVIQEFVRLQNRKQFGAMPPPKANKSGKGGGMDGMDDDDFNAFKFINPFGPPHPHDDSLGASMHMRTVRRPTLDEAAVDLQSISKSSGGGKQMVRPLSRFELTSRVMQTMDQRIASDQHAATKRHSVSLPSLRASPRG